MERERTPIKANAEFVFIRDSGLNTKVATDQRLNSMQRRMESRLISTAKETKGKRAVIARLTCKERCVLPERKRNARAINTNTRLLTMVRLEGSCKCAQRRFTTAKAKIFALSLIYEKMR